MQRWLSPHRWEKSLWSSEPGPSREKQWGGAGPCRRGTRWHRGEKMPPKARGAEMGEAGAGGAYWDPARRPGQSWGAWEKPSSKTLLCGPVWTCPSEALGLSEGWAAGKWSQQDGGWVLGRSCVPAGGVEIPLQPWLPAACFNLPFLKVPIFCPRMEVVLGKGPPIRPSPGTWPNLRIHTVKWWL